MGNIGSKAARKLPKSSGSLAARPPIRPTRLEPAETIGDQPECLGAKPDGGDPHESFATRVAKLGQVQYKPNQQPYEPASKNALAQTLENRARLEQHSSRGLPYQTLAAIVLALQNGESRDHVIQNYGVNDETLDKLGRLTVPQVRSGLRR